jgi:hypothetical protein
MSVVVVFIIIIIIIIRHELGPNEMDRSSISSITLAGSNFGGHYQKL